MPQASGANAPTRAAPCASPPFFPCVDGGPTGPDAACGAGAGQRTGARRGHPAQRNRLSAGRTREPQPLGTAERCCAGMRPRRVKRRDERRVGARPPGAVRLAMVMDRHGDDQADRACLRRPARGMLPQMDAIGPPAPRLGGQSRDQQLQPARFCDARKAAREAPARALRQRVVPQDDAASRRQQRGERHRPGRAACVAHQPACGQGWRRTIALPIGASRAHATRPSRMTI